MGFLLKEGSFAWQMLVMFLRVSQTCLQHLGWHFCLKHNIRIFWATYLFSANTAILVPSDHPLTFAAASLKFLSRLNSCLSIVCWFGATQKSTRPLVFMSSFFQPKICFSWSPQAISQLISLVFQLTFPDQNYLQ